MSLALDMSPPTCPGLSSRGGGEGVSDIGGQPWQWSNVIDIGEYRFLDAATRWRQNRRLHDELARTVAPYREDIEIIRRNTSEDFYEVDLVASTLGPALCKLVTNARFIRLSYWEEPDLGGSGHGLGFISVEGARSILAAAFAVIPHGVAPTMSTL